jgi:hypothetical protein
MSAARSASAVAAAVTIAPEASSTDRRKWRAGWALWITRT